MHTGNLCVSKTETFVFERSTDGELLFQKQLSSLACLISPKISETQKPLSLCCAKTGNIFSNTKVFVFEMQKLPVCGRLKVATIIEWKLWVNKSLYCNHQVLQYQLRKCSSHKMEGAAFESCSRLSSC